MSPFAWVVRIATAKPIHKQFTRTVNLDNDVLMAELPVHDERDDDSGGEENGEDTVVVCDKEESEREEVGGPGLSLPQQQ